MFSSFKQRIILGIYIFLVLSIPVGAYLASQFQTIQSSASEETTKRPITNETPPPIASSSANKLKLLEDTLKKESSTPAKTPTPESESTPTTIATAYGATLSLNIRMEGRPSDDQSGKVFLGILEGSTATPNPTFILNYTLDMPKSGSYGNISLAGLTTGNAYTAIIKGSTQIATASAFTMSPDVTNLNGGETITLTTGDLNDDNVINSSDYSIVQRALSSTSSSENWNEAADFNKDGIVNLLDIAYIMKNFGKTGDSGTWYSTTPETTASPSASLKTTTPQGGPPGQDQNDGYWIWVPKSPTQP